MDSELPQTLLKSIGAYGQAVPRCQNSYLRSTYTNLTEVVQSGSLELEIILILIPLVSSLAT